MCCVSPRVHLRKGEAPICVPGRCRDRLCPTCQRFRARDIRRRLRPLVQAADQVRFLTLTIPADDRSLGARIDALYGWFRDLRRRRSWTGHVKGGAFFLEVTRGSAGQHWHVHLHILVEGDYWSKEAIKTEWSAVVGKTANIDIRAIHGRQQAISYVTKYVVKGADVHDWPADEVLDLATGLHRRRAMGTFGTWHAAIIDAASKEPEREALPPDFVGFATFSAALESGVVDAAKAASLLSRLSPVWRMLLSPYVPQGPELEILCTGTELGDLTEILLDISRGEPPPAAAPAPTRPRTQAAETMPLLDVSPHAQIHR